MTGGDREGMKQERSKGGQAWKYTVQSQNISPSAYVN